MPWYIAELNSVLTSRPSKRRPTLQFTNRVGLLQIPENLSYWTQICWKKKTSSVVEAIARENVCENVTVCYRSFNSKNRHRYDACALVHVTTSESASRPCNAPSTYTLHWTCEGRPLGWSTRQGVTGRKEAQIETKICLTFEIITAILAVFTQALEPDVRTGRGLVYRLR